MKVRILCLLIALISLYGGSYNLQMTDNWMTFPNYVLSFVGVFGGIIGAIVFEGKTK